VGGVCVLSLWSAVPFVGVASECGLQTRFDGTCSWVLKDRVCCLGLVVVIMAAICLLSEDGHAAAAAVEALPCW
jgi:hypothetical protein